MQSKEEIENNRVPKQIAKILDLKKEDTDSLIAFKESIYEKTVKENIELKKKVEQLETDKQKLIEKLEKKIKNIDKLLDEMITDMGDGIKIINLTGLTRKEKEEVVNKRNCLLVQKYSYKEILKILKGEIDE